MGVFREQVLTRVDLDNPTEITASHGVARRGEGLPGPRRTTRQLNQLARTIELEVVPRLVLSRRAAPMPVGAPLAVETVTEFAQLALAADPRESDAFVEAMQSRGTSVETIYLELLAPTARHFGELWSDDLLSFSQVTLGLVRLHQVMRGLSPLFQNDRAVGAPEHRILLTPVPGEQHSFGVFMVAEFFHRAGWQIWSGPMASVDELTTAVRADWFAVVGLSVSSHGKLETLVASIRAVRRASCNPGIGVMVGGPVFQDHPEMVREVGADAGATDGKAAVTMANGLLELGADHG